MQKQIGFGRNIYRPWLDAAGDFRTMTDDPALIRQKLDTIVASQVTSAHNRRLAIDILVNIWVKSGDRHPAIHDEALALYQKTATNADRVWLHFGLTLLTYPLFRDAATIIGQLSQYGKGITPGDLKQRLIAKYGQLGGLDKAAERMLASLRDWGLLVPTERRYVYLPQWRALATPNCSQQQWLLGAALAANPAEELSFPDLVNLPELFPFHFTLTVDDMRRSARFEVHRQGITFDMVRLRESEIDETLAASMR